MTAAGWICAGVVGVWAAATALVHAIAVPTGWAVIRRGRHPSGVALTFDDGPHPVHTGRILDVLEAHGAKGTFFVLGTRVREYPLVLGAVVERGHEVQLHGYLHRHPWFTSPWRIGADLAEGVGALADEGGVVPRYFRPPWGMCSLANLVAARRLGMRIARWSVCPESFFRRPTAEQMADRILSRIRGGDIVCLHDAGGFKDTPERVAACLHILLPRLSDLGLGAVTLSEVLHGA